MSSYPKLVMSLILAVCCASARANEPVRSDGYIDDFLCIGGHLGLHLPVNARMLFQLGPILRQATGEVEQAEGYTTTQTHLSYAGFELGFITFSNDPSRYMISYAEVTSPDWQIAGPFRVGDTVKSTYVALAPYAQHDSQLKQSYGSEVGVMSFEHSEGTITKIKYDCYTG
jgi:hypothetical protein